MASKNYTDVLIGGKVYTLGGLEEESYLQQVASYINEKLAELRRQNGFLKQSEDYQSVMAYLNLADDYFKEREHARTLLAQKEELEKEAYSLKHELVGTQMKIESLLLEMKEQKSRGKSAADAELKELRAELAAAKERAEQAEKQAKEQTELAETLLEEQAELEEKLARGQTLRSENTADAADVSAEAPRVAVNSEEINISVNGAAGDDTSAEEIHRLTEQMEMMKAELDKYKALEAARDSIKGQKGHR